MTIFYFGLEVAQLLSGERRSPLYFNHFLLGGKLSKNVSVKIVYFSFNGITAKIGFPLDRVKQWTFLQNLTFLFLFFKLLCVQLEPSLLMVTCWIIMVSVSSSGS